MARRGEQFEQSVYEFYKNLDPNAQIFFDHKVRDRDTGRLRQVDVWVVHRILGQFPVEVLISCKDHSRALDVGEVELLGAEMRSTGAAVGVLYGRNGFTAAAIAKARALRISCCRLFENAPPDHPNELIMDAFVTHPVYSIVVEATTQAAPETVLWNNIFASEQRVADGTRTVSGLLFDECMSLLARCCDADAGRSDTAGPLDAQSRLVLAERSECPPFFVHIAITWKWFRGSLNAYRLKGSYNATSVEFLGDTTVGPIPMHTTPHRSDWHECAPPTSTHNGTRILFTALAAPTPEILIKALGPLPVFAGGVRTFETASAESVAASLPPLLGAADANGLGISVTAHVGKPS